MNPHLHFKGPIRKNVENLENTFLFIFLSDFFLILLPLWLYTSKCVTGVQVHDVPS